MQAFKNIHVNATLLHKEKHTDNKNVYNTHLPQIHLRTYWRHAKTHFQQNKYFLDGYIFFFSKNTSSICDRKIHPYEPSTLYSYATDGLTHAIENLRYLVIFGLFSETKPSGLGP